MRDAAPLIPDDRRHGARGRALLPVAAGLLLSPSVALASGPAGGAKEMLGYLSEGGPVVLATLGVLIALSLLSWLIIGIKWLQLRGADKQTAGFMRAFRRAETFSDAAVAAEAFTNTPLAPMYHAARKELDAQRDRGGARLSTVVDSVERALRTSGREGMARLEKRLGFLATTASAAPFIGLFGTVWGIMDAFAYIRPDQPILTTVAPHIAHALIATAVGLATAIPAVMAYNAYVARLRHISLDLDGFADELLNRITRITPESPRVVAQAAGRDGR